MIKVLFSFLVIASLFATSVRARVTADVEKEFDNFKPAFDRHVSKSVQFLKKLTDQGKSGDVIAVLNRGRGVHGFSKKNRKLTDEEAKIALNALLFVQKTSAADCVPFPEGIDDVGPDPVQNHRHFLKVAWRLLNPKLGHIDIGTNFVRDDNAFISFRELIRAQMRFENTGLQTHDNGYVELGVSYIDNGIGKTNQYGALNLGKVPYFHAYNPIEFGEYTGLLNSTLRLRLSTNSMRPLLPRSIQNMVSGISDDNLDIFVVSQDLPWKPGVDILYRPQYWLDPEAPFAAPDYNHAFNVTLWSQPTPFGNTITREEGPISDSVNTHTMETVYGPNQIVSSGDHPSAGGVLNAKRGQNFTLFTLTRVDSVAAYNPAIGNIQQAGRYALTLHLMLNQVGTTKIGQFAKALSGMFLPKKIYHLSEQLDADPVLSQLYRLGF